MKVIIRDKDSWLFFSNPQEILIADKISTVKPVLEKATKSGFFTAGIISYEAASAFDEAFPKKKYSNFPLVLIGLFNNPVKLNHLPELNKSISKIGIFEPTVSKEKFVDDVNQIKRHIEKGETYQVNYTYRLNASFSGNSYNFFKELIKNQQSSFASYIETDTWSICSASPELFFRLEKGSLITRPMKGTSNRGRYKNEDIEKSRKLKYSKKNQAENIMIVDMIRNDLGRIAETGSIKTVSTFDTERYPTLWQMTSTVKAKTKYSGLDVFKALFPCASITGAPKVKTMEIISNIENSPREGYTGSIGYFHPNGDALFNVAIRTALINRKKETISYGVGSGIIWDSNPDDEFNESIIKAEILLASRHNFNLVETMLWCPKNKISLINYHLERMKDSAHFFNRPFNRSTALFLLKNYSSSKMSKLRLLLNEEGNFCLEDKILNQKIFKKTLKIKLASKPINSSNVFLFHKTTNREVYQDAIDELGKLDEIILWNEKRQITEGTIFNIAILRNGIWITPIISCGLLNGVKRSQLIDSNSIQEGIITIEELYKTKEIMLFNSVRGCLKAIVN